MIKVNPDIQPFLLSKSYNKMFSNVININTCVTLSNKFYLVFTWFYSIKSALALHSNN